MEVCRLEKQYGLCARLLVKLEYLNPSGSVKDRAAMYLIRDAQWAGEVRRSSGYHRSDFWKHRNCPGCPGCRKRVSSDPYDAGDDDCGTCESFESLWCRSGSDAGRERYDGSC